MLALLGTVIRDKVATWLLLLAISVGTREYVATLIREFGDLRDRQARRRR